MRGSALTRGWAARLRIATAAAITLAAGFAPERGDAAMVQATTSSSCNIRLDGPIEPGDRDRLKEAGEKLEDERVLCLNSPGGSFGEALLLMDVIGREADGFWTTIVDNGDRCEAECAFVFMAGRYVEQHAINGPRRRLHLGGTLRFELPKAPLAEGPQSAAAISAAYQQAVDAFAGLVSRERAAFMGPLSVLPRSLLLAIGSSPETPVTVDTVEQAGLLGIDLVGTQPLKQLSRAMLRQACANVESWSQGRPSSALPMDPAFKDAPIVSATHESQYPGLTDRALTCYTSALRDKTGNFLIRIDAREKGGRPIYATVQYIREGLQQGDGIRSEAVGFARNTAGWAIHPPQTPLSALR